MAKRIICRCEDITEDEILDSIKKGYNTVEKLKRFTGLGTGFCQGKSCIAHAARLLLKNGIDIREAPVIKSRSPIFPTEMKYFVGGSD